MSHQEVNCKFIHVRGTDLGSGPLTHVPGKHDWIDLEVDIYVVVRVIWHVTQTPLYVEVHVDNIENSESLLANRAVTENLKLIAQINDKPSE